MASATPPAEARNSASQELRAIDFWDLDQLVTKEDAFSGEEYFMGNPVSGYHRYYKPTTSEREDPSFVNDAAPLSTLRQWMVTGGTLKCSAKT